MNGYTTVNLDATEVIQKAFQMPAVPTRTRVRYNIDPGLGTLEMHSIHHRYFGISEGFIGFKHNTLLKPGARNTHFGLAIMNSETSTVKFQDQQWVDVNRSESYFSFNPGVEEVHRFQADRGTKVHFIQVDHQYLASILEDMQPEKNSTLFDVRERVRRNEFAGVRTTISLPIIHNIISGMFACRLEGTLGNLALEGSLHQLLAMQMSLFGNDRSQSTTINHRDREIMNAVKEYLHANFNDDHTLADLAKRFGVNQNKLKTQFRELFGVPVIGYLFDLKMEHARMLLHDKGMFVNEVARAVGYSNPNHFGTAFKRKYGTIPSKLKG